MGKLQKDYHNYVYERVYFRDQVRGDSSGHCSRAELRLPYGASCKSPRSQRVYHARKDVLLLHWSSIATAIVCFAIGEDWFEYSPVD